MIKNKLQKRNIWICKTKKILILVLFVGHFCIPGSGSRYTDPNQSESRSTTLIKAYLYGLIPEESLNLRLGEGRPVSREKSTEETKVEVVIKQEQLGYREAFDAEC